MSSSVRPWLVLGLAVVFGGLAAWLATASADPAAPPPVSAPSPAEPARPAGLTDAIPSGRRALTLGGESVQSVPAELHAGDRVDVVAASQLDAAERGHTVARLLLEGVEVARMEPADGRRGGPAVTVLVTPSEALALASAGRARFTLLARPRGEDGRVETGPVTFTAEGAVAYRPGSSDLLERILPGMRAVTIEVRDTDGVAGRLRRGDRVDVILTSPYSWFASDGLDAGSQGSVTETRMVSRTLLQDVEVLATERSFAPGPKDDPRPVRMVTVLVTPDDAERLAVATDATRRSVLRLVGRNAGDRARPRTDGQLLSDLLSERRERSRAEIIRGGRTQSQVFYE